MTIITGTLR